jgi:hypothetical protein
MPALVDYEFYFLPCFPLLLIKHTSVLSPLDACAHGLLLFATILSTYLEHSTTLSEDVLTLTTNFHYPLVSQPRTRTHNSQKISRIRHIVHIITINDVAIVWVKWFIVTWINQLGYYKVSNDEASLAARSLTRHSPFKFSCSIISTRFISLRIPRCT